MNVSRPGEKPGPTVTVRMKENRIILVLHLQGAFHAFALFCF